MISHLSQSRLTRKLLSGLSVLGVIGAVGVGSVLVTNGDTVTEANAAGSAAFVAACSTAGGTNGTNASGQGTCYFPADSGMVANEGIIRTFVAPGGLYQFEAWGAEGGITGTQESEEKELMLDQE